MPRIVYRTLLPLLAVLAVPLALWAQMPTVPAVPAPLVDDSAPPTGRETAVLAGGCFWGMESVFRHVKGVVDVTAGYSGGTAQTAAYPIVSAGTTDHAESVRIVFDPAQVTFGRLLQIYFSVAHDPTQLNRQGPDRGRQYRSAIFYTSDGQKRVAEAYLKQLQTARAFARPIVTQLVPFNAFYAAEAHHQDYAERHPNDPYIVINDRPKVVNLRQQFPELYASAVAGPR